MTFFMITVLFGYKKLKIIILQKLVLLMDQMKKTYI